jgi:hypothetical protein
MIINRCAIGSLLYDYQVLFLAVGKKIGDVAKLNNILSRAK